MEDDIIEWNNEDWFYWDNEDCFIPEEPYNMVLLE
jgi:hypothetical protein